MLCIYYYFTLRSLPKNPESIASPPDTLRKNKQPVQSSAEGCKSGYSHRSAALGWPSGEDQTQPAACLAHPSQYNFNLDAQIEVDNIDEGEIQARGVREIQLIFVYVSQHTWFENMIHI